MEDVVKKYLKGSESRDRFKLYHKTKIHGPFYAIDIDLALVEFGRGIVCFLDSKKGMDSISDTEFEAYDDIIKKGYKVGIVHFDNNDELDNGNFSIYKYVNRSKLQHIIDTANWEEFAKWELEIRQKYRDNQSL